jgi:hypothetical protein
MDKVSPLDIIHWSVLPEIFTRQDHQEIQIGTWEKQGEPYWCGYMLFELESGNNGS